MPEDGKVRCRRILPTENPRANLASYEDEL